MRLASTLIVTKILWCPTLPLPGALSRHGLCQACLLPANSEYAQAALDTLLDVSGVFIASASCLLLMLP